MHLIAETLFVATNNDLVKEMHDLLVASQPDGAIHVASECDLCNDNSLHQEEMVAISTTADVQEQIADAVAAAVALKDARITELEAASTASTQEAEIASVRSELDVAVAGKLAAEERADAAEKASSDLVAYLEGESVREAVRDERIKAVEGYFPAEYVASRADDWANLTAEAFEAVLEDVKAAKATAPVITPSTPSTLPSHTAMTATADPKPSRAADLKAIMHLREQRVRADSI